MAVLTGLDIFALIVLLTVGLSALGVVYLLASWPGRIARQRNHPDARAIEIGGWATLLAGGVFWPLVLVWAYREFGLPAAGRANQSEK